MSVYVEIVNVLFVFSNGMVVYVPQNATAAM